MTRRRARPASVLLAAALILGSLGAPESAGAAGAAHAIVASAPVDGPTVDLLIGARAGRGAAVAALTAGFGSRDRGAVRGLQVRKLRVPASAAAAVKRTLATDPSVSYVEVDAAATMSLEPDDPHYNLVDEWGLPLIGAPAAWDTSTGANGAIIAVIDTGVDATHPDLGGRVLPGYDFANGDSDPSDDNGHGTHVAGIAAATGNNATGGAGVCWGCRILPVKALDSTGNGAYSDLASGITWAADHGARIINMSLGGPTSSPTLDAAIVYAQGKGVVVVAAAGNFGVPIRSYPAATAGVLAVGASGPDGLMLDFSNYGTDWVDVSAGGCSVSTWPGGSYNELCGTSMATPFVAGSLGLLLTANPLATPAWAVGALQSTAGPQSTDGTAHGLIHLDAAMAFLQANPAPPAPPPPPPVVVTRSASLNTVPKSFVILSKAGAARISLTNPRHYYLVVTLKRAGAIVWRRTTRSSVPHWTVNLRTASYTVTVSRPGARTARGTVKIAYYRR